MLEKNHDAEPPPVAVHEGEHVVVHTSSALFIPCLRFPQQMWLAFQVTHIPGVCEREVKAAAPLLQRGCSPSVCREVVAVGLVGAR